MSNKKTAARYTSLLTWPNLFSALALVVSIVALVLSSVARSQDRDLSARSVMLHADGFTVEGEQSVTVQNGGTLPINSLYLRVDQTARGTPRMDARTQSTAGQDTVCVGPDEGEQYFYLFLSYLPSGQEFSYKVAGAGTDEEGNNMDNTVGLELFFKDAWSQWWKVTNDAAPTKTRVHDEGKEFGECRRVQADFSLAQSS